MNTTTKLTPVDKIMLVLFEIDELIKRRSSITLTDLCKKHGASSLLPKMIKGRGYLISDGSPSYKKYKWGSSCVDSDNLKIYSTKLQEDINSYQREYSQTRRNLNKKTKHVIKKTETKSSWLADAPLATIIQKTVINKATEVLHNQASLLQLNRLVFLTTNNYFKNINFLYNGNCIFNAKVISFTKSDDNHLLVVCEGEGRKILSTANLPLAEKYVVDIKHVNDQTVDFLIRN